MDVPSNSGSSSSGDSIGNAAREAALRTARELTCAQVAGTLPESAAPESAAAWRALRELCWCSEAKARSAAAQWLQQLLSAALDASAEVGMGIREGLQASNCGFEFTCVVDEWLNAAGPLTLPKATFESAHATTCDPDLPESTFRQTYTVSQGAVPLPLPTNGPEASRASPGHAGMTLLHEALAQIVGHAPGGADLLLDALQLHITSARRWSGASGGDTGSGCGSAEAARSGYVTPGPGAEAEADMHAARGAVRAWAFTLQWLAQVAPRGVARRVLARLATTAVCLLCWPPLVPVAQTNTVNAADSERNSGMSDSPVLPSREASATVPPPMLVSSPLIGVHHQSSGPGSLARDDAGCEAGFTPDRVCQPQTFLSGQQLMSPVRGRRGSLNTPPCSLALPFLSVISVQHLVCPWHTYPRSHTTNCAYCHKHCRRPSTRLARKRSLRCWAGWWSVGARQAQPRVGSLRAWSLGLHRLHLPAILLLLVAACEGDEVRFASAGLESLAQQVRG